ncbi:MAG: septum formation initiator family protein, partial [Pseudomonadales bacterium]|nr:septum formation initiator family protein [Pseudomonadales bacterium]
AERNSKLDAEVIDLKNGRKAIEEKARNELGMVKKGETFILVIEN